MAQSKNRDFSRLALATATVGGTAAAQGQPAAIAPTPAAPLPPAAKGRPPVDTLPMQIRLPRDLMGWLVNEAAQQSMAAGKNVTPQQIILQIVEKARG